MDRKQFLTEMKDSFFQTIKEISNPFVEEKLEKMDQAMENITGIHWEKVQNVSLPLPEHFIHDIFIARLPLMLLCFDGETICILKKCKKCGAFMNYISYLKEMKCLPCDLSISLQSNEVKEQLYFLHTKEEDGYLWIALPLEFLK